MTGRRRRGAASIIAATVLVLSACSDDPGEAPSDRPGDSGSSQGDTGGAPPSDTSTDLPPPPTTDCLPATPVELDLGPYLRACAVTPTSWTITNTSRTVVNLAPAAGYSFPAVFPKQAEAGDPRPGVSDLLSGVYDLYRSQIGTQLWLQPGATVDVLWPGDTPGTLVYEAVPEDSAAMTAAEALVGEALKDGAGAGRISPDDVLSCYKGVRDMAEAAGRGQFAPTSETWNTAIDDGLTARTCFDLIPEQSRSELKAAAVSAGEETLSELRSAWHEIFSIVVRR